MLPKQLGLSAFPKRAFAQPSRFPSIWTSRTAFVKRSAPIFSGAALRSFSVSSNYQQPTRQVVNEDANADEVVIKRKRASPTKKAAATPKEPKAKAAPKKTASAAKEKKPVKAKAKKATPVKAKAKAKPTPKVKAVKKAAPKPKVKSTVRLPKLIKSAWMLYYTEQLPSYKAALAEGEKINISSAVKTLAEQYRQLASADKQDLETRLEDVKKKYQVDLMEAVARLTPEQIINENKVRAERRKKGTSHKRNLIDPTRPKRPMSAFFIYLDEKRSDADWLDQVKEATANDQSQHVSKISGKPLSQNSIELTAISKKAGDEWRAMSDDAKKPYHDQSVQSIATYKEAIEEYNAKNAK